jgi:hypothetical protein
MVGISLTVIVCAVALADAADGLETVRACEVYNEARPITDLRPCLFQPSRDRLGLEALERAGRQLLPEESVETSCKMMTGGGLPAA